MDPLGPLLEGVAQGLQVEAFLAPEVVLDHGAVGLGPFRDVADAGAIEALVGEDDEGGFQQAAARVLGGIGWQSGFMDLPRDVNQSVD